MSVYFENPEYEDVKFLGHMVKMPSIEQIKYYRDKMKVITDEYIFLEECIQGQADKVKKKGPLHGQEYKANFG